MDTGVKECSREQAEGVAFQCENQFRELLIEVAYNKVNEIIKEGIESIVNILTEIGFMNIDLLDIKAVLHNSKDTTIRVGEGKGDSAADKIMEQLMDNNQNNLRQQLKKLKK